MKKRDPLSEATQVLAGRLQESGDDFWDIASAIQLAITEIVRKSKMKTAGGDLVMGPKQRPILVKIDDHLRKAYNLATDTAKKNDSMSDVQT